MDRQIKIRLIEQPLPAGINAALHESDNDNYIIFVNSEKTADERAAAFLHECLHIYHRDFDSTETADQIEHTRHNELLRLLKIAEREAKQK